MTRPQIARPLIESELPNPPAPVEHWEDVPAKKRQARERNRTADLRITSALLYRLSYSGLTCYFPLISAKR